MISYRLETIKFYITDATFQICYVDFAEVFATDVGEGKLSVDFGMIVGVHVLPVESRVIVRAVAVRAKHLIDAARPEGIRCRIPDYRFFGSLSSFFCCGV